MLIGVTLQYMVFVLTRDAINGRIYAIQFGLQNR